DEWTRFERGYQQTQMAAIKEEKQREEKIKNGPGLPRNAGPFLYPGGRIVEGDNFRVLIETTDSPFVVADYYRKQLGAVLTAGHDEFRRSPLWEGDFSFDRRQLHVRIASPQNSSQPGGAKAGANIYLTAPLPKR